MSTFASPRDRVYLTLAQNYTSGSGQMVLTSTPSGVTYPIYFVAITNATYNSGSSEVAASYTATGITGSTLTGVAVLAGSTDQNFSAGDHVDIRGCAQYVLDLNAAMVAVQTALNGVPSGVLKGAGGELVAATAGTDYLAANQTVTLSGDATGSGATAITVTVAKINGASLGTTTATGGNLLIGSGTAWVTQAVTGDVGITSGGVTTVSKVHGVSYPANPGTNTVPVVTGANTINYEAVPNAALANSSITVTAGTGLSGGGSVSLGSSVTINLSTPVSVANGGTGDATMAAYAVVCGGTTSTGALQQVSGLGTSGYVLTSNGAGALPTWQPGGGGGSGITALTGDVLASGTGSVAALFSGQTALITPGTLGSTQNNWSPTGWLSAGAQAANVIRFGASAYIDLTGLAAPSSGNVEGVIVTLELLASSAMPVRLVASSGSSSAGNQFLFVGNVFLAPGESLSLKYDNTAQGWRELTGHKDFLSGYFGSGQDGAVSLSSGTTTLTRDMYYQNLTLSGTASIVTNGYRIFVSEMLDISGAQAGAIQWNGGAGGAGGATGTAGAAGTRSLGAAGGMPFPAPAASGAAGGTGAGAAGTNGSSVTSIVNLAAAAGGAGGSATSGGTAGGGASSGGNANQNDTLSVWGYQLSPYVYLASSNLTSFTPVPGSGSGGSGGGDGTNKGGGGGGSATSGGMIWVAARFVNRGSSTTAGILQAKGGAGGAGGSPASGTAGGGGGGGSGGGGAMQIYYGYLLGSTITNALDCSSGTGGAGGNGISTGAGGNGGGGAPGGKITAMSMVTGVVTETIGGSRTAGGAASGATGGTAGPAVTTQQNL